ncbi:MAG TPA: hypothetical protein VHR46_06295 [Gaiella sp.]|nr:hypothetical protein [Gaiella sp.]
MGRVAAVLRAPAGASRRSIVGAAALLAALAAWDAFAGHLPDVAERWDVLLVAALLFPATFLVPWLLLPLATVRGLVGLTVVAAALAALFDLAGLEGGFNSAKIVAFTLFGFWFVQMLEALSWVVVVAAVIPWIDIASVYQGPTKVVVEEKPGLFERIAVSFSVPGEDAAARLGPPDVIFFALFLAAAGRFGLRVGATWIAMTACLSATLGLTYAFDLRGLPALPALSVGFVLPNADLLWRAFRTEGRGERRAPR